MNYYPLFAELVPVVLCRMCVLSDVTELIALLPADMGWQQKT